MDWFLAAWDWIGRNAATIIALAALGVACLTAWTQRRHNRLSVRPKITLFTYTDANAGHGRFIVEARNAGLGSAIVHRAQVWLDGSPVNVEDPASIHDAMRRFMAGTHQFAVENSFTLPGQHAMRAGDGFSLVAVQFLETPDLTPIRCSPAPASDSACSSTTGQCTVKRMYVHGRSRKRFVNIGPAAAGLVVSGVS